MDLETENRLAALLMEEARRLRCEADKEGVHIYLHKPNIRGRPNSRFLTATVLGVQQANRATEVGELWRAREKELELDAKQRHQTKVEMIDKYEKHRHEKHGYSHKSVEKRHEEHSTFRCSSTRREESDSLHGNSHHRRKVYSRDSASNCSSSKCGGESSYSSDDGGLKDDEVDDFLRSRAKRGRGSIGCRMDEPGPYLPSTSLEYDAQLSVSNARSSHEQIPRVLGPEKPSYLKSSGSHDVDTNIKDINICKLKKHHTKEMKLKEKSKKRRRKEKKSRHEKMKRRSGSE